MANLSDLTNEQFNAMLDELNALITGKLPSDAGYILIIGSMDGYRGTATSMGMADVPHCLREVADRIYEDAIGSN